jgi:hypothetical protein
MSISEPPMRCRNDPDNVKTDGQRKVGKSSGGNLFTARMAFGIEVA